MLNYGPSCKNKGVVEMTDGAKDGPEIQKGGL
jgi:hypothetical protein